MTSIREFCENNHIEERPLHITVTGIDRFC